MNTINNNTWLESVRAPRIITDVSLEVSPLLEEIMEQSQTMYGETEKISEALTLADIMNASSKLLKVITIKK